MDGSEARLEIEEGLDWVRPDIALSAKFGNIKGVRALLAAGAHPDTAGDEGMTALHWAAWMDDRELCSLLLGLGADTEIREDGGRTALIIAAWAGAESCFGMLIAAGAALGARGLDGRDAADVARTDSIRGIIEARRERISLPYETGPAFHSRRRGRL